MLPSRPIARSLPSAAVRRQISSRVNPPSALHRLGNGRQFGTSLRSGTYGLGAQSSPFRSRHVVAPMVLGGISSSRSLSLWGYGKKSTPVEEVAAEAATTTTKATEAATEAATSAAQSASDAAAAAAGAIPETLAATEPAVAASELDLSSISEIVNGADILAMPEGLGYLGALGLDYGWGPTSMMQWSLEHAHVYIGLGWGASILATAFLLRAVMFYPQVRSQQFNAVMQEVRKDPRSKEATRLIAQSLKTGDAELRQKASHINKLLRQEKGVSNWGMLWALGQIPFTFGMFRIVNGMVHVPVPSLETDGFLWFYDLTARDPYFILPAAGTALMLASMTVNSKYVPASQKKMMKTMLYVLGPVGLIFTSFLSAAINLMALSVGASTLITALIINAPSVRRRLGLPLTVDDTPPAATAGTSSSTGASGITIPTTATYEAPRENKSTLKDRLNESLGDMKKGFNDQVSNMTGQYQGTDAEKAERKRRDMIRKLEEMRKKQEKDEFEKKYKSS